jgi:predicted DCC family thiol-disulfide oxidoreductase YuxK
MDQKALLIYDGDCAFCKNSLQWAIGHLKQMPNYVAFQKVDLTEYRLTKTDVETQVWLLVGTKHFGGHQAVAWLFKSQTSPFWRLIGTIIDLFGPISALVYRWVAKNRHRLPGGTKECSIEDRP